MAKSSYRVGRWTARRIADIRNYIVYLGSQDGDGGTSNGSIPSNALLDETGQPIFDEAGQFILT